MDLTCRQQDQERFEALGFAAQNWENPESALVVMLDEQANYAHCGNLPNDIPYHGYNGAGGSYGDGVFACDGKEYAEVEGGIEGGFVVDWDEARQRPLPRSLRCIRRYIVVRNRVRKLFATLAKTSPPKTRSNPSARTSVRRGRKKQER